jgi:hypothetical protein
MYYKPSGKISVLSILICSLAVLLGTILIGIIYTYAVWYIPLIYINFLLTIGSGFALFILISFLTHRFKSRSKLFDMAISVIASVLLVYVNWVIWVDLVLNSGETYGIDNQIGITVSGSSISGVLELFLNPKEVLNYANIINGYGTWGIKGGTVSGTFLWIIWIIEAAILFGFTPFMTLFKEAEPFCEIENEWAEKKEVNHTFKFVANGDELKRDLENNKFEPVLNLEIKEDTGLDHMKMYIYYAKASALFYLSIKNFTGKLDKENKVSYSEKFIVENIEIPQEVGLKLLTKPEGNLKSA